MHHMEKMADRFKKAREKHEKKEHKKHKMKNKEEKVMHEFKTGMLHSGSKKGPVVKNRKQAIAIGLSEARKAGEKVPKKKK
jgi:ribosomal protein L7/L12